MKCPKCGKEIGKLGTCPYCGGKASNALIDAGNKMQSAGKSMEKIGCAMTLGCTIPILIVVVILLIILL